MDNEAAREVLEKALILALQKDYRAKYSKTDLIEEVISGGHKTFRYILVTGILAKTVDSEIHPRSIQAGSKLQGSYDARSLCHKVFVPFERERLSNALGGSNEPYLNKPARFPELDSGNACKGGVDKKLLESSCEVLESLNEATKREVFAALCDCLYYTLKRLDLNKALLPPPKSDLSGVHEIQAFIEDYVSISCEGETCATVVGALISSLKPVLSGNLQVTVHPANQAGSSSKEVSDIDVKRDGELLYTIEIKDKKFAVQDVGHAVSKVEEVGHESLVFVEGPQALLEGCSVGEAEKAYSTEKTSLIFVDLLGYSRSLLTLNPGISPSEFYELLVSHCEEAKVKDKTLQQLAKCARNAGWID